MNRKKEEHENSKNEKRILVVAGHPAVRQQLTQLISQESNFRVCAEAENAAQALSAIETQQVDLAIVDTFVKDATLVELVEKIKLRRPNLPVMTIPILEFLDQRNCE